jgi:hypothetical protein
MTTFVSSLSSHVRINAYMYSLYIGTHRSVVVVHVDGLDYVSELRPAGISFIPQTMHEYPNPWWNDNERETRRIRRGTCPSATLSTTNPKHID